MGSIAAIGVHILVPLFGVIGFASLCRRMWRTHVPTPPVFSYFILFVTFGGWLMVCLTALFWRWSGMASLGIVYLILIAPFATAGIAFALRNHRALSGFHQAAYLAALAYSAATVMTVGGWLGVRYIVG
jgi:hypothetical protein